MSVQTIYTSALYKFAQSPDNARFSDDYYSAINNAQRDFCTARPWGFLRTTAALTATHAIRTTVLPSDFSTWYDIKGAVRITSPAGNLGDEIEIMSYEDWLTNEYEDGSQEGTPSYCYIMGSNVEWSPIPDATYTVSAIYYKTPSSIDDTSSTITIPAIYEEVLQKMIWKRLIDFGYSSIQELSISDNDITKLLGQFATHDIKKYGGLTINLSPNAVNRRTV